MNHDDALGHTNGRQYTEHGARQRPASRASAVYVTAIAIGALAAGACGQSRASLARRDVGTTLGGPQATPQADGAVHAPPGYAHIGDVVHLVFRPACIEAECTRGSGELHTESPTIASTVIPMMFDPNEGFSADITVRSSLHYWAQFSFASTTARWPAGRGTWSLEVIDRRPIAIDVTAAATGGLTTPAMELVFGIGSSATDIGLVPGDQSAGMGPSAITAIPGGGIVIPDPVNSRLMVVDRAKLGTVSVVALDHRPEFAAALAVGFVTVSSDSKVRFVDPTGNVAFAVDTPISLGAPIGFTMDEHGVWLAGLNGRTEIESVTGVRYPIGTVFEPNALKYDYTTQGVELTLRSDAAAPTWTFSGMRPVDATASGPDTVVAAGVVDPEPDVLDRLIICRLTSAGLVGSPIAARAAVGQLPSGPRTGLTAESVYVLDQPADGHIHISRYDFT